MARLAGGKRSAATAATAVAGLAGGKRSAATAATAVARFAGGKRSAATAATAEAGLAGGERSARTAPIAENGEARHGRQGRRRLLLPAAGLAVAAVLAAAFAVAGLAGGKAPAGAAATASVPLGTTQTWPQDLVWPSERSFKADQVEALDYAPQAVFFGGSRSVRFDAAYLEKKTGLKGFNLALTNGKPEDAWAFAHFLHDRSPATQTVWIWGVQVSTMYTRDLDPGLIQDARLSRYLPTTLLAQQAALLPTDPDEVPPVGVVGNRRYTADGRVVYNPYDRARDRGVTLERSLEIYINRSLRKLLGSPRWLPRDSRSRDYFEKTLALLNEYGITPIIMTMPMHPEALAAFKANGFGPRHAAFLAYLDGLRDRYDFRFIDLTEITSFGGDPNGFYDGVHIDVANARRVTDRLVEAFPNVFREAEGG